MAGSVDILPKQFFPAATPTTLLTQVVDTSDAKFGALQAILDTTPTGTEVFSCQAQHSNVNEEATFLDVGSPIALGAGDTTDFTLLTDFGRYLRVVVTTTDGGTGGAQGYLRLVLVLKDAA